MNGVDPEKVKRSVEAKKVSKELLEYIGESKVQDKAFMLLLLEAMRKSSGLELPTTTPTQQYNVVPIARLGNYTMNYGEFTGKTLDDIPLPRLDWYCRKAEDTFRMLKAYLLHPDLQSYRGESLGELE